jgi:hypothetical protein
VAFVLIVRVAVMVADCVVVVYNSQSVCDKPPEDGQSHFSWETQKKGYGACSKGLSHVSRV